MQSSSPKFDALQGAHDPVRDIATEGFSYLPGLCPPDFLERILSVCHGRIDEVREALGDRNMGIGSAAGFDEVVQRSPGRWDLPISPERFGVRDEALPWWPLVTAILGQDAEHSFSGVVYSRPGSPAQRWHVDSPHLDATHRGAHALNALVALHDIPLDMGPTEIARGSHRLTNHHENPDLVHDELVYQHDGTAPETLVGGRDRAVPEPWCTAMAAGSVLLFDDRILHRGLGNESDRVRYVAYFSYRQAGYAENTHFEAERSVFDRGR